MSETRLRWRDERELVVDGVTYELQDVTADPFESSGDRFCIYKARWAIEELERLLDDLRPLRIAEIGLKQGGSTALICQLAEPERLVGIELDPGPVPGLTQFAAARGIEDRLSIHTGVDQADRSAVVGILGEQFAGEPIDLAVDDASHALAESRATFEAVFPLLRPGGVYLLEDWSWAHTVVPLWLDREPLTPMVFELVLACGHCPDVISAVEINRGWAVVRRGPADLGEDFALERLYGDRGRALLPPPGAGARRGDGAPGRPKRGIRGRIRRLLG